MARHVFNRTQLDEGSPAVTTAYERNELNQFHRAEGGSQGHAQGYRYDEDGNLVEAYVAADMNCDGQINNFDVDPYVLALVSGAPDYEEYYLEYPNCNALNGDLNGDGYPEQLRHRPARQPAHRVQRLVGPARGIHLERRESAGGRHASGPAGWGQAS